MKYIIQLITVLFLTGLVANAGAVDFQLKSTSFDAGFNRATSYNDNFKSADSIKSAENWGFGAEMKIGFSPKLRLNIGFSYVPMRVAEYDAVTAMTRTGFPYANDYWNSTRNYINRTQMVNGVSQKQFEVTYDYRYYMYYLNLNIGIDYAPVTEGRFQPFIGVGISPVKFDQRGHWITNVTGHYYDTNGQFVGDWHYEVRAHTATRNKHRGYYWNGWVAGGMDFMITKNVGIQVKGRFFQVIADNDRNRITGYWNIGGGFVFHQ